MTDPEEHRNALDAYFGGSAPQEEPGAIIGPRGDKPLDEDAAPQRSLICSVCGIEFAAIRVSHRYGRDRYCSNRCRQKAYRQRHRGEAR